MSIDEPKGTCIDQAVHCRGMAADVA